ncbi:MULTISPECIES: hypothetical protein [Chryseobacterium]|nr:MULTISPECIES: hypothetical protein [Chryseobacterium]
MKQKFSFKGSYSGFKDRDYIILYTTHRQNEFGDGQEGINLFSG